MMTLAFKFNPLLNVLQQDIIEELSYHTTRLYNIVNYDMVTNEYNNYYENDRKYKLNYHNNFLHSHNYQCLLKVLDNNWKSYFAAKKDYEINKHKYKNYPNKPGYKNIDNKKNEIIFTNLGIRFRNNILMLSLSKNMKEKYKVKSLNFVISDKLQNLIDFSNTQQVKIKYDRVQKNWYLIVIYRKEELISIEQNDNIMAIDLGLNNLASCTNLNNINTLLVNGKPVKSINRFINNEISKFQRIEMLKTGNKYFKNTKRIIKLKRYRNNYIHNYLHKASKLIIQYACDNKCGKIIIGDIKNIKQNMNYNANFVQVPIQKLVSNIKYKAKLIGIEVILIEESYTSGCSAFDLEDIKKSTYNKKRRIKRGLFKTNKDIIVNSDINGSLNILRKYIKDVSIPKLIKEAMDKGSTSSPIKSIVA